MPAAMMKHESKLESLISIVVICESIAGCTLPEYNKDLQLPYRWRYSRPRLYLN